MPIDPDTRLSHTEGEAGVSGRVRVERVEMLDYSTGFTEPAEPIWRIVLNGYCADFPTETAARNFAAQIAG